MFVVDKEAPEGFVSWKAFAYPSNVASTSFDGLTPTTKA